MYLSIEAVTKFMAIRNAVPFLSVYFTQCVVYLLFEKFLKKCMQSGLKSISFEFNFCGKI